MKRKISKVKRAAKICSSIPFQGVMFYPSCDTRWIDTDIAVLLGIR